MRRESFGSDSAVEHGLTHDPVDDASPISGAPPTGRLAYILSNHRRKFIAAVVLLVTLIVFLMTVAAGQRSIGALAVLLGSLAHWYFVNVLGYRVYKIVTVRQKIVLHAAVGFITVPAFGGMVIGPGSSSPVPNGFVVFCYFEMGLAVLLLQALLLGDLVHGVWLLLARFVPQRVPHPSTVTWWQKAKSLFPLLLCIGLSLVGVAGATRNPPPSIVEVTLSRLPPSLDGFRIGYISDIHLGPTIGEALISKAVATLNALDVDIAAIVGDITDTPVEKIGAAITPLLDLQTRYGTFFVTGNHEYYLPAGEIPKWIAALQTVGVQTLSNARVSIPPTAADSFDLAGVDDWTGPHNLAQAVEGRDTSRELVLLAHQPKQIEQAAEMGVGLQLSGHVHCGQMPLMHLFSWMGNPYFSGLHLHQNTSWIYVSCGTGYWGPVIRIAAPSEVTLVVLRAPESYQQ